MSKLFRKHPIKILSNSGAVSENYLKARIPTWKEVLGVLFVIFLLLLMLLFFVTFNKKIKSEGVLVQLDGQVKLVSPISGTVLPFHKKQGDNVFAGDKVFAVTNEIINPLVKKSTKKQLEDLYDESKLLESNNIAKKKMNL